MARNQYLEHIPLQIAAGQVLKTSSVDKFGYNPSVGGSFETVWSGSNIYTYIVTAGTAVVTSSNTAADNGGTVLVQGLDANYDEVSETITIGGAAGSVLFHRVHRASLITATTADTNSGDITVTVDTKSVAIIPAGYAQTLMAVYTIPRRKTGFLMQMDIGNSKSTEIEAAVIIRNNVGVWNAKAFITTRDGFIEKNFHVPLKIPELSDIEIRVKGSATSSVSAAFELVLVDK